MPLLALQHHRPTSITSVTDAWPTWREILDTLTLQAGFNTTVVILGTTLLGLAGGIVGVFALLRKRSLVADALSHATLPGIALAFLAATALGVQGRSLPVLLLGATVTGVLGVVCIQALLRATRLREDAAIGLVLSVFFGMGIVLLSYIQTNASAGAAGLDAFIYGQTAAMSRADALLMGAIALASVLASFILLKEFTVVCFNDAFARVTGWPVGLLDLGMMALVVVVTVAGLQAVGLILVVAMLIIPPVAARLWTDRLWKLLLIAGLLGATSGYLGSSLSALLPRKPAGAVIVLTAGGIFTISLLLAPGRGVIASSARRIAQRLRYASDHLLEAAAMRPASVPSPDHLPAESPAPLSADDLRAIARQRRWSRPFRALIVLQLRARGMISRNADGLVLTPAGIERGRRVARNHALWEQYLIEYADIAPSHVDWSVDQVEHVLSGELVARLERALARRSQEVAR